MTREMLTLKAESPLALHRRRASEQFGPTLAYLPGSTVRGALAYQYLAGEPDRAGDRLFRELFLSEDVCFSDFFPGGGKGLSRLYPATATACKRFDDHALTDSLLRLELAREMESSDPLELDDWGECPDCRNKDLTGKRDRIEPGYYLSVENPARVGLRKRMIIGTAIERATGTAAHAMLFSHEVIEESSAEEEVLFRGVVTVPDDRLRLALHDLAPYRQRLAVGYGRSRGLGQLSVHGWDSPPVEQQPERWATLNRAAEVLWRRFNRRPDGQYFSLSLQSHLALENPAGEPVLGEVVATDLGLPAEAVRCRSVLSAVAVPGWNAALDLPKADTWALGRGSVLLFRLPPESDPDPTLARLAQIEQEGVGLRRAEGFGRAVPCDPFHFYFLQRELEGVSR